MLLPGLQNPILKSQVPKHNNPILFCRYDLTATRFCQRDFAVFAKDGSPQTYSFESLHIHICNSRCVSDEECRRQGIKTCRGSGYGDAVEAPLVCKLAEYAAATSILGLC